MAADYSSYGSLFLFSRGYILLYITYIKISYFLLYLSLSVKQFSPGSINDSDSFALPFLFRHILKCILHFTLGMENHR